MIWFMIAVLVLLAYLTFVRNPSGVAGLKNAWMLLAGVLAIQALSRFVALGDDTRDALLILDGLSWGVLAGILFVVGIANVPASVAPPGAQPPPQLPPDQAAQF